MIDTVEKNVSSTHPIHYVCPCHPRIFQPTTHHLKESFSTIQIILTFHPSHQSSFLPIYRRTLTNFYPPSIPAFSSLIPLLLPSLGLLRPCRQPRDIVHHRPTVQGDDP